MIIPRTLSGRQVIYSDTEFITAENVVRVLQEALPTFTRNSLDTAYLYKYYKGIQPILNRTKEIRPEINNKLVENRANEIISFKVGYLMGEPIQYVSRGGKDENSEAIGQLNEFVFAEDKAAQDRELAEWFYICGNAYRMVLPDAESEEDESPFEIYTLDPRDTFVVYYSGLGHKELMGVTSVTMRDGTVVYTVYTDNVSYEIVGDKIVSSTPHYMGYVPIIEYPANPSRLGAFEIVLPLLDAINEVGSNRLDGIEQFIQSLLVLKGVDIDDEEFESLRANGGLKLPTEGDAKYLVQELNQTQTQTLVDYLYQTVLTICGMPNRNGGSSTSDTGSAVIMRDGWSAAEARAKDTELMFKKSEKKFLKVLLNITNTLRDMNLKLSAVEIRFTRRNYENIQEKTQVLTTLLASEKVHPRLAYQHCGLFIDPDLAWEESLKYMQEEEEKLLADMEEDSKPNNEDLEPYETDKMDNTEGNEDV